MDEIEITYSETEFTLKNGFTLSCPFEVCAVASLWIDDGEVYSTKLEAVVSKQGQIVPVHISDFIKIWFDENQSWFETQFNENTYDYGISSPRSDYEEHSTIGR